MQRISYTEAETLVCAKFRGAGVHELAAKSTAQALVLAEAQGHTTHGLSRVPQYLAHLRNGRVNVQAVAQVIKSSGAVTLVDAQSGLAFPACGLAIAGAARSAKQHGIGIAGVINSHHAGVLGDHLRPPAEEGLVGLAFANVPSVMPMAGGRHPVFGTNPIAAVFPRRDHSPLIIDLSLSEVTRGKIAASAKAGNPIPLGWALDANGDPTTDAKLALSGSMLPVGAASSGKGAMLALVVEMMAATLIGAHFSFEASSFFVDEGNSPQIGQTFIAINPDALAGQDSYFDRLDFLTSELLSDDGVRLPGMRREAILQTSKKDGIEVTPELLALITSA
ncbi:MAG TPA: Ldh family oxidoreductase [Schlesneria sp.]